MLGMTREEVLASGFRDVLDPPEHKRLPAKIASLADGKVQCDEWRFRRKNGSVFIGELLGRQCPDGRFQGVVRDITERKRAEEALRESEEQFHRFVEQAPAAIAMFDQDMRYVACSERWLDVFGLNEGSLAGRSHYEVFPEIPENWKKVHRRGLAGEVMRAEEDVFERAYGRKQWVRWEVRPWRKGNGEIGGITILTEDVTGKITAARALRESEEVLRFVTERAEVGYWHWDIEMDRLEWSPLCKRLFGIPRDEPMSYERFLAALHPEDRERTHAAVRACLDNGGKEAIDIEYRTVWPDGAIRWIQAKGSATFDGSRPVRMAGIALDITGRKSAEEQIHRQADLLDQSHDAILVWQIGGGIAYWSKGAERLYGWSPKEAVGRVSHDLLQTSAPIPKQDIEARISEDGEWYGELLHRTRDGRQIIVESRHVRVCYGEKEYALESNRDISERKRQEERVHLLLREVNHRAKNLLGVVQVIASQTAASDNSGFISRFSERLRALAANQDLLVKNQWKGIEMPELVRAQLAHFACLVGGRIKLTGAPLQVAAEAAQPISMALHELATNAGKYGALSNGAGQVSIAWRIEEDGGGGSRFKMSWRESGGPVVMQPKRRGYGTTVISRVPELQLAAVVRFDFVPEGVAWHLDCPADKVQEVFGSQFGDG
jgi:PAS domain S-box-containing protein